MYLGRSVLQTREFSRTGKSFPDMVFQNLIGNGVSWSFSSDTGKFKVCSGWWHHSDWRRQACICHRGTAVHQDGHGGESPPLPDGGHRPRHHRQAAQRTGSQLREGRLRQGAVLTGVLLALWGSGTKCLMNPWVSVSSYSSYWQSRIRLPSRKRGFNPWVGKIPWRRKWQPTLVCMPGKSLWAEEPGGLHSMELQKSCTWLSI